VRRVGLFAALLLLLGLTTATAASFDVQAEDITSFTTAVSITVPTTDPPAPPTAPAVTYYMVDAPANANLVSTQPTSTGGNEKASFDFGPSNILTEERALQSGNKAYYVSWRSGPIPPGMTFVNRIVRVHFTRTGAAGGQLVAGLFSCDPGVDPATVQGRGCRHLGDGESGGETIDIIVGATSVEQIDPGDEFRLKMVSATTQSSSIQWGYKENNRSARVEILP
jgi:hypothetical protein